MFYLLFMAFKQKFYIHKKYMTLWKLSMVLADFFAIRIRVVEMKRIQTENTGQIQKFSKETKVSDNTWKRFVAIDC